MRFVIVGGVAAGAGAAARLRRLDEKAEIVLLERGDYISFANCGLPYHLGGVIAERESLLVMTPKGFGARFNVDIRTGHEALAINIKTKSLKVRKKDGSESDLPYDKLLLATGSSPITPPVPGVNDPRILPLWTIPDLDKMKAFVDSGAKSALVVGGGFIGLEAAENLRERGLAVTLVELLDQILPPFDREMTSPLAAECKRLGIKLELGRKVTGFSSAPGAVAASLDDGRKIECDFVVMSVGVRPNSGLAKDAGLTLGERGHIAVDEFLRTSDPDIYAAGDAVEVIDPILGGKAAIPLAGPANKQGRIAADNLAGRKSSYGGSIGASIIKIGNLAGACVGHTERRLRQLKIDFRKIYIHPPSHASYYPGAARLHMKVLFSPEGKILGAQIVGSEGADKRIDVIATAIKSDMNVRDLAELELSYAPPFNSAKDPVNMAGMVAGNILDGESRPVYADSLPQGAVFLDVREPWEVEKEAIPNSLNIPLGALRGRVGELPSGKPIVIYCQIGLRGYIAERILRQKGFDVFNLSGGYVTWKMHNS